MRFFSRKPKKMKMIGSAYRPVNTSELESTKLLLDADGICGTIPVGTSKSFDLKLNDDVLILAGALIVNNSTFGDYAELSLVDVDGVYATAGTVMSKFVKKWYVQKGNSVLSISVPVPAKLLAGLYIRVTYTSTATFNLSLDPVGIAGNYTLYKILV